MTSSRRAFLALAGATIAAAGLSACAPGAAGGPSSSAPPADPSRLDEVFQTAFAAAGLVGAAAYVRFGGAEWRSTAGVADLDGRQPYPSDGYVRIASITKTFVGTVILQMVDEGLLSLDDVLETYIPGIPNGTAITIRQMLQMQSGIFDFTSAGEFYQDFDADPTRAWSIDDTIAIILRNAPVFEPGAKTVYCDSNFALLGAIAEQVDGAPLADIVTRRTIARAGLAATYYPTDTAIRDPHPTPYVPTVTSEGAIDTSVAPRVVDTLNPAVFGGAAAMISTLADLSLWGDELVTGTLLAPDLQAERLQPEPFDGQTYFGYGLGILTVGDYAGHDGAIYGFSTTVLTRAETGTQIVIVSNDSTNSSTPTMDIAIAFIDELDPQ